MNCIVIATSGLRAQDLGCYGGPWCDTPAFDQFATEALIFDHCLTQNLDLRSVRTLCWTGRYALPATTTEPNPQSTRRGSLIRAIRSAGVACVLIRDSHALVGSMAEHEDFEQVIDAERGDEQSNHPIFLAAQNWIVRHGKDRPFLLFIDCHGAHPPWPSTEPTESDQTPQAEDDDSESDITAADLEASSPSDASADPSVSIRAAVVSQLDAELGSFLDFLRSSTLWDQSLLILTSDRGATREDSSDPSQVDGSIEEQSLHVPLLLRTPGDHDVAMRTPALVQPIDLLPTVCHALQVPIPQPVDGRSLLPIIRLEQRAVRDQAMIGDPGKWAGIRTPEWLFIRGAVEEADTIYIRLYRKPEDRWGANDVAAQHPSVVEQLERAVESWGSFR